MPKIVRDREGSGGGGDALIAEEWVEIAGAIGPHENLPSEQILQFKEKPNGSNSTEQLLSRTNLRVAQRFWIMDGETRT
jgi:hypothetical protein